MEKAHLPNDQQSTINYPLTMYTDKTKAKFIVLRSEGWSISRIAKHLDISRPTLIKWNEEFHFAINSFRAVELEALQHSILEKLSKISLTSPNNKKPSP